MLLVFAETKLYNFFQSRQLPALNNICMKTKFLYILIIFLFSGCNEFIDLTGKFINRLNDTKNLNIFIKVSVTNLQTEHLSNILISIIDDQDSVFITPSKFTNDSKYSTFTLPDEQVNIISEEAQNIIIVAEHPEFGILFNKIPLNVLYERSNITCEFMLDLNPAYIKKKNIREFPFYNNTLNKSNH